MIYTNRHNLPEEIVKVLTKNRYNENNEDLGDYSATTLVAPIQQTILKRRYPDKLKTFDVIDMFHSFVGSIAHKVLEEHGSDASLVEKRFYANVLGKKISGQVDHYKDGVITDYKSTKAYKIMNGDFSDWEQQLNIYAWLARANSFEVNKLRIFAFILDWKNTEAYKKDYPKCPIVEIVLDLWDMTIQTAYVNAAVDDLIYNHNRLDEDLPQCTPREMWQDVKDFAIVKNGSTRARKCFTDAKTAKSHLATMANKSDYEVIKRMTARTRCLYHCPVSNLCAQNRKLLTEEGGDVGEIDATPTIF